MNKAIELFRLLGKTMHDDAHQGYFEGGQRNWTVFTDNSIDDVPTAKTMNTHPHLLETFTNLLRAWDDTHFRSRLAQLIQITLTHIVDPDTGHFKLHFDAARQSLSDHISYGHDIEGSWLLTEAAEILGEVKLLDQVRSVVLKMAQATLNQGVDADGGLFSEGASVGVIDPHKNCGRKPKQWSDFSTPTNSAVIQPF